jgi:small subunit ribosomal protein S20
MVIDAVSRRLYKRSEFDGPPSCLASILIRNFIMANTRSAKKANRVATRRHAVNRNRVSRMRSTVKKVEEAIETGGKAAAEAALKGAEPELMRGAQKGVIHKNAASRKVSRLAQRIKKLA